MQKILCTGGAGFIGSHLVDALIEQGHQVIIIDNMSTGNINNINSKAILIKKDITENIDDIFDQYQFDCVFHLAAQINLRESIKNPIFDAQVNIMGSLNVISNCHRTHVPKIIFSSTGGAIYSPSAELPCIETSRTEPMSPYGMAKLTVENYLRLYNQLHGQQYVALRFANVYGPRQAGGECGVISIFMDKAIKNQNGIIFGDGSQTRDYIYVKDVISACLSALRTNTCGVFNVSTNKETSVNELVSLIKTYVNPTFTVKYTNKIEGELHRSCLSNIWGDTILKWKPYYNLVSGIQETAEYYKCI